MNEFIKLCKSSVAQSLLDDYLVPDAQHLAGALSAGMPPRHRHLSEQLAGLVDQFRCAFLL